MFFEFENRKLNYNIYGSGKHNILFLHGWGCSEKTFSPIISMLPEYYTSIVVDFFGHGESDEPPRPFGVEEFSNATLALLKKLNLSSVDVVAHSFGARVATLLATNQDAVVHKLIITGGAGIVLQNKKRSFRTQIYKIQKNVVSALSKIAALKSYADTLQEKLIQKYGSKDYIALSPIMRKTFVRVVNQDLQSYYSKIKSPTLLIWGTNDEETPMQYAKIMNKAIEDSAIIEFQNCGHFAFLEDKFRFVKILDHFFSEDDNVLS